MIRCSSSPRNSSRYPSWGEMFQDRDEISDLRIAYVNNREIDMNKKSLSKKRVFEEKSNTLSSKPQNLRSLLNQVDQCGVANIPSETVYQYLCEE